MRIVNILPRNMHFGPSNATSIDLCVHDLVSGSRFRASTRVLCHPNETLFSGLDVKTLPNSDSASRRHRWKYLLRCVRDYRPDLVVVQQHVPTGVAIARSANVPVILHSHNMAKRSRGRGLIASVRRRFRVRSYQALAGFIFVSRAAQASFEREWPDVTVPRMVVPNGMKFEDWCPQPVRKREILCVGRASPEKGIKEAALAAVEVLRRHPDWRARFILSEAHVHPGYFMEVRNILATAPEHVTLQESEPWAVVKKHVEEAAIAIVPSRWEEPFGRTALEAHAGGCAVVSSGTGGLREISGEHAVYLPNNFSAHDISQALDHLIADERRRNFLATAGREFCTENYAISTVSGRADQCYESVVGIPEVAQVSSSPNFGDRRICPEVV